MSKKKSKLSDMEDLLTGALENMPAPDSDMDEEIVFIDTDNIASESKCDAYNMVEDLVVVYGDKKFMEEHPDYKKRLDIELENLRTLIKMKKSDEIVHDILVKSIGKNTTNASLYTALNKIQTGMLSIQKQMDETIKTLNNLLKNYQFELPLNQEEQEEKEQEEQEKKSLVSRGNKEFIMKQLREKEEKQQTELFEAVS